MSPPAHPAVGWAELPALARINAALLLCLAAGLCLWFAPAWATDPDLSHGLLMPVVFLLLVHESRSEGPRRWLRPGLGAVSAATALALAGLLALLAGGLYAAALDWSHALVRFAMAVSLSLLLGSGLVCLADERIRLIPFNWASWVAVALWPLSAPIPPGTYYRITGALQLWVSSGVLNLLHILGIPALRVGNIIELANTAVGVEDACSGIRSLTSCVFVGIFISAALIRRPWARVVIIALSAPLALLTNLARSLILTLLANAGVSIAGFWHDATGYAVLAVTALLLAALAYGLRGGASAHGTGPALAPSGAEPPRPAKAAYTAAGAILAWSLVLAALACVFFYSNTRTASRRDQPVPDLWAALPVSTPGWEVRTTQNLRQFASVLQTDTLAERAYLRGEGRSAVQITFYLAYWRPGQAPVSLVASHTPDGCWPGAGWQMRNEPTTRRDLTVSGRTLPPAEERLFTSRGYPQYVWFWHLYAGRPIAYQNPYSVSELLRIAWRYGFRHDGDQLFVRVSSNRPWSEISGEPLFADFFSRIRSHGL